ncbi:MAG: bifunctional riboflavin kinase/FAD synthetase, partial [Heliobacteriaceae bacterium]|nr:bifunctional riboflavin kinase/FAD synthetase [Heliobacteriaceae bacterium]
MEIINYCGSLADRYQSVHVALGNFDGVHLGHQQLIRELVKEARLHQGTAVVATFDPHPLQVVRPDFFPRLLTPSPVKYQLISRLEPDILIALPFNRELAALTPAEFTQKILVDLWRAETVMVGFNYSFGRGGKGTPQLLWQLGHTQGFRVKVIEAIKLAGETVSSTSIRHVLREGRIERAKDLLGYAPVLMGTVVHGDKRGRRIGFPTANLKIPPEQLVPGRGVYVALACCDNGSGKSYPAVLNIGVKPTFQIGLAETIEAHLIDCTEDMYEQPLTLHLMTRLRPEMKFAGPEQLIQQIQ